VKGVEKKLYNKNKLKETGKGSDIISYNKKNRNYIDNADYDNKKELIEEDTQNFKNDNSIKFKYYIVRKGDTLFSIAKRSRMSLKTLLNFNNLKENTTIYTGMKLKIPCNKIAKNNPCRESDKITTHSKPFFLWPLKRIKSYSRDGKDGVKSIGIFIKGNPGSEVIASEKGVVKRIGYMRGYGKYIVLNHDNRYISVYSNLMDVNVRVGETVQKGVTIGNISNDMTLHFQIDHKGKPENPLKLLPGKS